MHFVPADHVQFQFLLSEKELRFFEEHGVLTPVTKNGRVFYSARDLYRLRGILYFTRERGMSFEKAREHVNAPVVLRGDVPSRRS